MKDYLIFLLQKAIENKLSPSETAELIIEDMLKPDYYILIEWPESQDYMEKEWFAEEAVLHHNSSYFIPVKYLSNE